jgi:hypothetical protein
MNFEGKTINGKDELIEVLKRNGLDLGKSKLDDKAILIALQLLQLEELRKIGHKIK